MARNRISVKSAVRQATRDEAVARRPSSGGGLSTVDSFANFTHQLGVGADNPLSSAQYGFNPVTRNRIQLEWIYRGSWLGGAAVDIIADDMTRAGIDYSSEIPPEDAAKIDRRITATQTWAKINETIKWARLYGGCLAVILIDGQDPRTPLDIRTIGPKQFKGITVLDRWMVEPTLEDLVTDMGPFLGLPRFYRVSQNAPALRGCAVHFTRIVVRHEGIELPYQQRLTENLWGISIFERIWDRMISFDSATTGAAQLVYKAALRTLKVKDLRSVIAAGGDALKGLVAYVSQMKRFQGIEGITVIDAEDEFEMQTASAAFSGLDSALTQFGQQLAGALQVPLTRLFGMSPGGLSATGESDLRTYYDHIAREQEKHLLHGLTQIYRAAAQSEGVALQDDFSIEFAPLWEMTETDKATVAKTNSETITSVKEAGLISDQTALKELRQTSRTTGLFTNITQADIEAADDQVQPPLEEQQMEQLMQGGPGGNGEEGDEEEVGPFGKAAEVDAGPPSGKQLQLPTEGGGPAGGGARERVRLNRQG